MSGAGKPSIHGCSDAASVDAKQTAADCRIMGHNGSTPSADITPRPELKIQSQRHSAAGIAREALEAFDSGATAGVAGKSSDTCQPKGLQTEVGLLREVWPYQALATVHVMPVKQK